MLIGQYTFGHENGKSGRRLLLLLLLYVQQGKPFEGAITMEEWEMKVLFRVQCANTVIAKPPKVPKSCVPIGNGEVNARRSTANIVMR